MNYIKKYKEKKKINDFYISIICLGMIILCISLIIMMKGAGSYAVAALVFDISSVLIIKRYYSDLPDENTNKYSFYKYGCSIMMGCSGIALILGYMTVAL